MTTQTRGRLKPVDREVQEKHVSQRPGERSAPYGRRAAATRRQALECRGLATAANHVARSSKLGLGALMVYGSG